MSSGRHRRPTPAGGVRRLASGSRRVDANSRRLRREGPVAPRRVDGVVEPESLAFRARAGAVLVLFALGWLALVLRAGWLAVGPDDRLSRRVVGQHERIVEIAPKRGSIVDRMGRPLAVSVELNSLYTDPALVEDAEAAADLLAPLLDRDREDLVERLSREKSRFAWLARQLPVAAADRIDALDIPGVRLTAEAHREYPSGPLAAPILGFVNIEGQGLEGLEARHDDTLMGDIVQYRVLRDGRRRATNHEAVLSRRSTEGDTLVLTIDRGVQHRAEVALDRLLEHHQAAAGWVVSLDAQTGAVLAMASRPSFDPNAYRGVDPMTRRNLALSINYEPGSVMKPFVIAEVLERGLASPDERVWCEKGRFKIGRRVIHDAHPHDELSVSEIIKVSSNIGTAKLAERIGPAGLEDVYRRFGFGSRTGIDLYGEEAGILSSAGSWSRIGFANRAFGQGISVTGVQLTAAFAALVNGGIQVQPHVVAQVVDGSGAVLQDLRPEAGVPVVSGETSAALREMLAAVMEPGGTGPRARLQEYSAGGKTGTAQKAKGGRYAKGVYMSSFIGFAPVDEPRVVTLVTIDEPTKHGHYGGTVAGPVFAEVTTQALRALGVAPDRVDGEDLLVEVEARVKEAEAAAEEARSKAAAEARAAAADDEELDAIVTVEEQPAFHLPDLTGLSARDALGRVAEAGLVLMLDGSGLVTGQDPAAGEAIGPGETLKLALGSRAEASTEPRGR